MPETAIREPAPWSKPKEIKFPDAPQVRYVFERDCLAFDALVDGKFVKCLVSSELLAQKFGAGDHAPDALIYAFNQHKNEIEEMARRHIERGWADPFGNVILTTRDTKFTVTYHHDLVDNLVLRKLAESSNTILESVIGPTGGEVTAEWGSRKNLFGKDFLALRLSDKVGTVTSYLNPLLFEDESLMRMSLASLWSDLLQNRSQNLILKSG